MPDPTNQENTPQSPTPTTSPNPGPPTVPQNTPTPPSPNPTPTSPYSPGQGADASEDLASLRSELSALQARNRELEQADEQRRQQEEERRQAELSELEREREKVQRLETQLQEMQTREQLRQKQDKFWQKALEGGASPTRRAALLRLVDLSATTLTEGGDLAGVEAALEQARVLAPEFFGGSVTTNVTPTPGGKKPSERTPQEPESDFERGAQLMRSHKENKGNGRQRGRSKRL